MRKFWPYFWIFGVIGACSTTQAPKMEEDSKVGVNFPSASSDVFVTQDAWKNLIRYETGRAKMCLEMEKEQGLDYDQNFLGSCEINQFSFVAAEVEAACVKNANWNSSICEAFDDWSGGNIEFWKDIFLNSIPEVMQARQYNPWQIIQPDPNHKEKVAVTHLQKGNVFVELSIQMDPFGKKLMSVADQIKVTRTAQELGLHAEDSIYIYAPTLRVIINVPGLGVQKLHSEIFLLDEKGNVSGKTLLDLPVPIPDYGRAVRFFQFSKHILEEIKSAPALIIIGVPEGRPASEAIFSFKLEKGDVETVLDEVMTYFKEVSAIIGK